MWNLHKQQTDSNTTTNNNNNKTVRTRSLTTNISFCMLNFCCSVFIEKYSQWPRAIQLRIFVWNRWICDLWMTEHESRNAPIAYAFWLSILAKYHHIAKNSGILSNAFAVHDNSTLARYLYRNEYASISTSTSTSTRKLSGSKCFTYIAYN